jgi:hypothetical protein
MSKDFSYKQKRRLERAPERELLQRAKDKYFQTYGTTSILFRSRLNSFKKLLLHEDSLVN